MMDRKAREKFNKTVGENLVRLRKERKLTVQQAADKLGIPRSTLNHWELGTSKLPLDAAIFIVSKYRAKLSDLIYDKNMRVTEDAD